MSKKIKKIGLLLILVLLSSGVYAQFFHLSEYEDIDKVDIPFRYQNDLIVIDVVFQDLFPLKFIYDTGAEHTILLHKEITDVAGMPYEKEINVLGADFETVITAYLVRGVKLKINNIKLDNQSILALKEDYFHFDEHLGEEIHGILGAEIFKNFLVKINYQKQVLTLIEHDAFKKKKGYEAVPIDIFNHRPYVHIVSSVNDMEIDSLKVMIDTGAGLALLLHPETNKKLIMPEKIIKGRLGKGLGGYLQGYVGRTKYVKIGNYDLRDLVTNFQDLPIHVDKNYLNGRNGILGNRFLFKFHVVFDFVNEILYLKPNRSFNKKTVFDRSGLYVITSGFDQNTFNIQFVVENSPAYDCGLRVNDEILTVNRIPIAFYSLSTLNRIFRKRVGKKIRLKISRDGVKMIKKFRLRELI